MKKINLIIAFLFLLASCKNVNEVENKTGTGKDSSNVSEYSKPRLVGDNNEETAGHKKFIEQSSSGEEINIINNIDREGIGSASGYYADHFSKPSYVKLILIEKKVNELIERVDSYTVSSADSANIAREWFKNHKK